MNHRIYSIKVHRHHRVSGGPTFKWKTTPPPPPTPVPAGRLFSVGHSNQELPQSWFVPGLLAAARRQRPWPSVPAPSPLAAAWPPPQFNRASLERELKQNGIAYVFLGDRLGGRPRDRELYDADGRVDYERVRRTAEFRQGLERLLRGLEKYTIAMLCGEDDPLDCHRGLMIAPAAKEEGASPLHLRKDGSVETNEAMERRLLRETGTAGRIEPPLFAPLLTEEDRRAALAEAYRIMARRKGFRLETE